MHKSDIARIAAFLLLLSVLFSSCTEKKASVTELSQIIEASFSSNEYHSASSDVQKINESDFVELYFDKKTFSVNIFDKSGSHTWYSLPKETNGNAYMFELLLYNDGNAYRLNTQDNSVAFGTAEYKTENNVLTVTYKLSDKKETAQKNYEELKKGDVYAEFDVVYTLVQQALSVCIDTASIKTASDMKIASISFMPYFGASYDDSVGDYFLFPDSSGSVIYTSSFEGDVSAYVYGSDPYTENDKNGASALLPVFGVKRNTNAFACILTEGDALARIYASSGNAAPSLIGAEFSLSPCIQTEDTYKLVSDNEYNGKIEAVYKFLSNEQADYIGMAAAAREEFINRGILHNASFNRDLTEIPLCISLIGSQSGNALTTFSQATNILSILKGKGIDKIRLTYKGILSGGFEQKNLYTATVLSSLGGKDGYKELYDYITTRDCSLFTEINIFSSSSSFSSANTAYTYSGGKASYSLFNDIAFRNYSASRLSSRIGADAAAEGFNKRTQTVYSHVSSFDMSLARLKEPDERLISFLSDDNSELSGGFAVNDGGNVLYSENGISRQESMKKISSMLSAVADCAELSVKGGNLYSLTYADYVYDMNFDSFYPETESYCPVPFAEAVIHQSHSYSGLPIDAGDPLYKYEMLRCMEYGALPSFEWVFDKSSIFCYDAYLLNDRITEITEYYAKASDALSAVGGAAVTAHEKIIRDADGKTIFGVYRTLYSNGASIYVNYSGSTVVTPDNIVVGAYDFVKIER